MAHAVECECGATETEVTDSRRRNDGYRRRRRCLKCGKRWSTIEVRITDTMSPSQRDRIRRLVDELHAQFADPIEEVPDDE